MTKEQAVQCYGMSEADLDANIAWNLKMVSPMMLVACMLSDTQHLMELGQIEEARQLLNRAKKVLFDHPALRTL